MMRDIYTRASSVIIFLGDGKFHQPSTRSRKPRELIFFGDERDSQHILRLIYHCRSKSVARLSTPFSVFSLVALLSQKDRDEQNFNTLCTLEGDVLCRLFESLRIMLSTGWWSRIWVFQEVSCPLNASRPYSFPCVVL